MGISRGINQSVCICSPLQQFCFFISGYKYAGVQFAQECYCGNSYGKHGALPESDCGYKCPGDESISCGGILANSIYNSSSGVTNLNDMVSWYCIISTKPRSFPKQ